MDLNRFNKLGNDMAAKELFACCGSDKWASLLMKEYPFKDEPQLIQLATDAWYNQCSKEDWLQSFSHHPEIGDVKSLSEKFAGKEQAGVVGASAETIEALAKANKDYKTKFGFIFIVCATGKPGAEMLRLLQSRLSNSANEELHIAMGEQHKITLLRLKKILTDSNFQFLKMSQLTTHVLDTSIGKPGKGIAVKLFEQKENAWQAIAESITNADGRIADLLPSEKLMAAGNYKIVFKTGDYFAANNVTGFYPEVEIQFTVFDESHYHVPLLINPFGYSTYRGS